MATQAFEITLTEPVDAPAPAVFAQVSDFDDLARMLRGRGARVERLSDGAEGMPAWRVRIAYRGVERDLRVDLVEQSAPERLRAVIASQEFSGAIDVTLAPAGPEASRLTVTGQATGKTLPARFLLQSLRLGQRRIATNLQGRLHRYGARVARDWRKKG